MERWDKMATTLIKAECTDQILQITKNPPIASGGVEEDVIEFSFCPLWDGFEKVAVFYRSERKVYHVQIADNRCTVPKEVLQSPGYFYVGVFGTKDGVTRTTNVLSYRVEAGAITEGVQPPEPTPSIYESILASVKSAEQIAQSVRDDADAGRFDGSPGAKGDPGSDASVTAENIEAALGYAPVKDVQVAGNSVLDGGVANVPVADTDILGVIKAGNATESGIWFANGVPRISFATDDEISSRNGQRKAIVCNNLDKAVKAAMCDGKGAAWTSAEQKAARDRMGVDKPYELIEAISITEETGYLVRNVSLRTVYIEMETPDTATANGGNEYVVLNIGSSQLSMYCSNIVAAGKKRYAKLLVEQKGGKYMVTVYSSGDLANSLSPYFQHNAIGVDGDKISKIHFTNTQLPVGTIIKIYGVSA